MVQKTPLYARHLALNAKMVDFHNWSMPLHYGSQLEEHFAVRTNCGIFDVSHMTIVDLLGVGGRQFLRKLLTNDVDQIRHNGKALYSCMCNEHGGIIDDLIVYQRSSDNFRVIFNAATKDRVLAWLYDKSQGFAVGIQERNDLAMLAVQGPETFNKLKLILSPAEVDAISTLTNFESVDIGTRFIGKTGYTGEDGVEIILPAAEIIQLWDLFIQQNITPCGLAARDTLRLEAGFLLNGQDMDESTTPLESGLEWTIKLQHNRDFIGMGALLSQKQSGCKRSLVGLIAPMHTIMRPGYKVKTIEGAQGVITSGTYSPTLKKAIALARIPVTNAKTVRVEIRGKYVEAEIKKPKFVRLGKAVIS